MDNKLTQEELEQIRDFEEQFDADKLLEEMTNRDSYFPRDFDLPVESEEDALEFKGFRKTLIVESEYSEETIKELKEQFYINYPRLQKFQNQHLYCSCQEPNIVINSAAGETFKICKKCKKEHI